MLITLHPLIYMNLAIFNIIQSRDRNFRKLSLFRQSTKLVRSSLMASQSGGQAPDSIAGKIILPEASELNKGGLISHASHSQPAIPTKPEEEVITKSCLNYANRGSADPEAGPRPARGLRSDGRRGRGAPGRGDSAPRALQADPPESVSFPA